jgi:hypothetical protein
MSIPVEICPICSSNVIEGFKNLHDDGYVDCPFCGKYRVSGTALVVIPRVVAEERKSSAKLSHAIRLMQDSGSVPRLNAKIIEEIIKRPLPKPSEQADLLMRLISQKVPGPGETVFVDYPTAGAAIGAMSEEGFALVLKHLVQSGMIEGRLVQNKDTYGRGHFTPTILGWEYYESLRQGQKTYRKIFMAMQYSDVTLDRIVEEIIRPAIEEVGFILVRLDDNPQAGLIDDRLRVEIQSCDLVISDLTHDNAGAYWESGYAEGLGKPVVYTCEKEKFESPKTTHFDTNHHLTVVWDEAELDSFAEKLKATIRATLPQLARSES